MTIDDAINAVIAAEGGYVNNPNDAGGETNFGITIATARSQGYAGAMRDMPRAFAAEVYRRQYVIAPGFDQVAALSMPIAAELVDTGVNMGPAVAGAFLQRVLNALGNGEPGWPTLIVDGHCAAQTRAALKTFLDKRGREGERRLRDALNALQGERYVSLAEGRPKNKTFLYGWLARIAA